MITVEELESLAGRNRTPVFPNIVREYFQHLFLSALYHHATAEHLLFKGGTALRMVYGSPRFSEDLDFSLYRVAPREQAAVVESLFGSVLAEIEGLGAATALGPKVGPTTGGYFGDATFRIHDYTPAGVVINVHAHPEADVRGEVATIAQEFVPTYTLLHLPLDLLVREKLAALVERKKARDFYDLYFLLRRGLLSAEHKQWLAERAPVIERAAQAIDFGGELSVFLPADQHALIKDFPTTLRNELRRQLGVV